MVKTHLLVELTVTRCMVVKEFVRESWRIPFFVPLLYHIEVLFQ